MEEECLPYALSTWLSRFICKSEVVWQILRVALVFISVAVTIETLKLHDSLIRNIAEILMRKKAPVLSHKSFIMKIIMQPWNHKRVLIYDGDDDKLLQKR